MLEQCIIYIENHQGGPDDDTPLWKVYQADFFFILEFDKRSKSLNLIRWDIYIYISSKCNAAILQDKIWIHDERNSHTIARSCLTGQYWVVSRVHDSNYFNLFTVKSWILVSRVNIWLGLWIWGAYINKHHLVNILWNWMPGSFYHNGLNLFGLVPFSFIYLTSIRGFLCHVYTRISHWPFQLAPLSDLIKWCWISNILLIGTEEHLVVNNIYTTIFIIAIFFVCLNSPIQQLQVVFETSGLQAMLNHDSNQQKLCGS